MGRWTRELVTTKRELGTTRRKLVTTKRRTESRERGDEAEVGPVKFVRDVLKEEPYEKQVEILEAVTKRRRVSVVGLQRVWEGLDGGAGGAVVGERVQPGRRPS